MSQDDALSKYYPELLDKDWLFKNEYYTSAYSRKFNLPLWATYLWTPNRKYNTFRRSDDFRMDPRAPWLDSWMFLGSGLDRGQLVPWEAMSFDSSAVSSSFLYTNVSPAYPAINRGIWNTIEEFERRFVSKHDTLVVIAGHGRKMDTVAGYWGDPPLEFIAPRKYFKILLSPREKKAIGFLVPNLPSSLSYDIDPEAFVVSIDDIERYIGIGLFPQMTQEERLLWDDEDFEFWGFSRGTDDAAQIHALVIGNDNYHTNHLEGAISDALAVGEAIESLGGQVDYGYNLTGDSLRQLIEAFYIQSDLYDWNIFYYAGHGLQGDQGMTLIGVDSESPTSHVPLDYFLAPFAGRKDDSSPQGVAFIDACRTGIGQIGFEEPMTVKVQFSTKQGAEAFDSPSLGVYAKTLSYLIVRDKEFSIDALLTNIAVHVYEETSKNQLPTSGIHGVLIGQKSLMEVNPKKRQ